MKHECTCESECVRHSDNGDSRDETALGRLELGVRLPGVPTKAQMATALADKADRQHAPRHAPGGDDPLAPEMIGAMPAAPDDGKRYVASGNAWLPCQSAETGRPSVVYVAHWGDDDASGAEGDPFASPAGALRALRARYPGYFTKLFIVVGEGEFDGDMDLNDPERSAFAELRILGAGQERTILTTTKPLSVTTVGRLHLTGLNLHGAFIAANGWDGVVNVCAPCHAVLGNVTIDHRVTALSGVGVAARQGASVSVHNLTFRGRYRSALYGQGNIAVANGEFPTRFENGSAKYLIEASSGGMVVMASSQPVFTGWVHSDSCMYAWSGGRIILSKTRTGEWLRGQSHVDEAPSFISGVSD